MLAAYDTRTEAELHLAADIVSFGFQALEALSEAAADLSLNQKLRLRASAVSLSREAHKARRKLDQLIRARANVAVTPEASAAPAEPPAIAETPAIPEAPAIAETPALPKAPAIAETPATDQALGVIEPTPQPAAPVRNSGGLSAWTRSRQQRRAAEIIAKNLRRNAAEQARRDASMAQAAAIPSAAAHQQLTA
jgi:hypothetical protein